MLHDNADSDSGGYATLKITPDLRASPADNAVVTVNNCKVLARLADNSNNFKINNNSFYLLTLRAIEALNGS